MIIEGNEHHEENSPHRANEEREDLIDLKNKDSITNFMDNVDSSQITPNKLNLPTPGVQPKSSSSQLKDNFSFDRDAFLSNHIRTLTAKSENDSKKPPKEPQKQLTAENSKPDPQKNNQMIKQNDNWSERSSARDTKREVHKQDNEHVKSILEGKKHNNRSH